MKAVNMYLQSKLTIQSHQISYFHLGVVFLAYWRTKFVHKYGFKMY